jgi:hypothetical protein
MGSATPLSASQAGEKMVCFPLRGQGMSLSCRTLLCCALLGLVCSQAALGQKIKVDYDRSIDFRKFKTYTWGQLNAASMPLLRINIIGAIDEQLQAKGLVKVEKDADLMVTYVGAMDGDIVHGASAPIYPGYSGRPPAINATMWTGSNGKGASGASLMYPKGSLLVEMMDPHAAVITWRAVGKLKLDTTKKKESLEKINDMIAKMFDRYPPKKN